MTRTLAAQTGFPDLALCPEECAELVDRWSAVLVQTPRLQPWLQEMIRRQRTAMQEQGSPQALIERSLWYDLERWVQSGARVEVTVDIGTPGWRGQVGLVTALLPGAGFDPARTTALMCGPEIMMRFTTIELGELEGALAERSGAAGCCTPPRARNRCSRPRWP